MEHLIAPSILSCDFANIESECNMLNSSKCDWYHVDIMDGVFVPNISIGLPIVEAFKRYATKPLDVHLMMVNPDRYVKEFKAAGADNLTVHYEACTHLHRTVDAIKSEGMKAGVAINPHVPIENLSCILPHVELICLMTINPGFGGQKLIPEMIGKISDLKQLINKLGLNTKIEIDGGVTVDNARTMLDAGADILVAGSAVFKSANPMATIQKLKSV